MILPFDELNSIRARLQEEASVYSADGVRTYDKEKACDILLDYLIYCYVMGVGNANEMLSTSVAVNTDEMRDTIYKRIAGKDFEGRVSEYAGEGNIDDIMRVAETDATRVMNTAADITAVKGGARTKAWATQLDLRVRETHSYLEGMTVGINDRFVTFDGDSARFPGDFERAENNVNCRCWLIYK